MSPGEEGCRVFYQCHAISQPVRRGIVEPDSKDPVCVGWRDDIDCILVAPKLRRTPCAQAEDFASSSTARLAVSKARDTLGAEIELPRVVCEDWKLGCEKMRETLRAGHDEPTTTAGFFQRQHASLKKRGDIPQEAVAALGTWQRTKRGKPT